MTPSEVLAAIKAAIVAAAGATAHQSAIAYAGEIENYFGDPVGLSVTLTLRSAIDEIGPRYSEFLADAGDPPVETQFARIERSMLHSIDMTIDAIAPGEEYDFALALCAALNTATAREAHTAAEIELLNGSEDTWSFTPIPSDGRTISRCVVPLRWRAVVGNIVSVAGKILTVNTEGTLTPGPIVVTTTSTDPNP